MCLRNVVRERTPKRWFGPGATLDDHDDIHHVRAQHYVRASEGRHSVGGIACLIHDHLIGTCPECRRAWRVVATDQDRFHALAQAADYSSPSVCPFGSDPPPSLVPGDAVTLQRIAVEADRLRRENDRAWRDLWELRRLPASRRRSRIRNARVRFASRMLAERIVEESIAALRISPREAEHWASLVADVLARVPGDELPWKHSLAARAAAHHANSQRVSGDLTAAARGFVELRRDLARRSDLDLATLAEVASLEASLAIDQRQFGVAEELLAHACFLAEEAGEEGLAARASIQIGNLLGNQGRADEALDWMLRASGRLDPQRDASLLLAAANASILSLCDLGRTTEAGELLDHSRHLYESSESPHIGCVLRLVEGRIDLSLGRLEWAVEKFEASRDGFLALDRTYDAVLASLDLAHAHLEAGDWPRLERLAARLVPQFRLRGISRETLEALALLARAVAARELTRDTLAALRRRLSESRGSCDG